MKKIILPAIAFSLLTFTACNSGTSDETTTDSVVTETSTTADETTTTTTSTVDLNASYMDLKSGKTFTIDRDATTNRYVNRETREPVLYYVNVATNDTFDAEGRWINGALIKSNDGNWSVDESRLRVKIDEDGDVKIKDGDDSKIKIDGNEAESKIKTDNSKEKMDGDKYKKKTDSTKTKIKQ